MSARFCARVCNVCATFAGSSNRRVDDECRADRGEPSQCPRQTPNRSRAGARLDNELPQLLPDIRRCDFLSALDLVAPSLSPPCRRQKVDHDPGVMPSPPKVGDPCSLAGVMRHVYNIGRRSTKPKVGSVRAGGKLTPLRRLRFDPSRVVAEVSGVLVSLARSTGSSARRRQCLTWSGGLSCAGSILFVGSRSRS
jgi:hypothetical protein